MKVSISAKGLYYLKYLAAHSYYQTRVGEDTIWYNRDLASLFIECLNEGASNQESFASDDALEVTDARKIFIQYLRTSLIEESENSTIRYPSKEWARVMNDVVERSVFGEPLTKSLYAVEVEGSGDIPRTAVGSRIHTPWTIDTQNKQEPIGSQAQQLELFRSDAPDYRRAIEENAKLLGPLPQDVRIQKSRYVVRVLWALEIAFRAGTGPLRASNIATIIREYGGETVADPNVAKFFRTQRHTGEYTHFWKEDPVEYYTLTSIGRKELASLLDKVKSGQPQT